MAIDQHYIPAFSIEDVLLDKDTGAPLAGGIVTFERSIQPGTKKAVYQITGADPNFTYTQLPNPMILSSIGTFEDALGNPVIPYFLPYDATFDPDYYRVIVESSGHVSQFVRDPVPYIPDAGGNTQLTAAFDNEISNPQFSQVLFDTTAASVVFNYTAANKVVTSIAPDWDIIVSSAGAATVTVSQLAPVGSLNRITNPGTFLTINSAGCSRLRLRQRLFGSPNLWGSGYLSATFVAKTYGGSDVVLNLLYSQSNGTVVDQTIVSATLPASGTYAAYPGFFNIPASDSNQTFPNAYVDIEFDIPLSTKLDITSVMVVSTGATSVANIVYDQESNNRQIDHLFHYWRQPIFFKPISSLLVGWDFHLNPAQLGDNKTISTPADYVWDQTIMCRSANDMNVTRYVVSGGMLVETTTDNDAFYLLQYLSGSQAKKIIGNKWSINVNTYVDTTPATVTCNVYLYRGSSAATIPAVPGSIVSLDSQAHLTLTSANWTLIPRDSLGLATGTVNQIISQLDEPTANLGFSGWQVTDPAQILDTDKIAIAVAFKVPLSGVKVHIDSISLVPGDIPTQPAPQTPDEVLRECQFYLEISDTNGLVCSMNSLSQIGTNNAYAYPSPFSVLYNTIKRAVPLFTVSSISGTAANVSATLYYHKTDNTLALVGPANKVLGDVWAAPVVGTKSLYALPKVYTDIGSITILASASDGYSSANIQFTYKLDARFGVV